MVTSGLQREGGRKGGREREKAVCMYVDAGGKESQNFRGCQWKKRKRVGDGDGAGMRV